MKGVASLLHAAPYACKVHTTTPKSARPPWWEKKNNNTLISREVRKQGSHGRQRVLQVLTGPFVSCWNSSIDEVLTTGILKDAAVGITSRAGLRVSCARPAASAERSPHRLLLQSSGTFPGRSGARDSKNM